MLRVNNKDTRTTSLKDADVFRKIGSPTVFRKKKTDRNKTCGQGFLNILFILLLERTRHLIFAIN